ncbi:trehalose-phosphatase [Parvularcula oceani]|uniref:trehalose-phosphatase n=1 Tax=Parvularcula oceani TaxID=1247963 RepID=UPI0004E1AD74|nr:trehalose-phosphatase [Parvularcula oceani]
MRETQEAPPALLTAKTALFLDFDGTLAPLQDDPDAVNLPEGGAATLTDLSERLGGAVALVSGRDARDVTARVPVMLWRAGNHGGIVLSPGEAEPATVPSAPEALTEAVREAVAAFPGVVVEEKAAVLAIHYRQNPDCQEPLLASLSGIADANEGYKLQHGKRVIELKPEGVDKGVVIERLMKEAPFAGRTPLFLGDDTTDEDGFAVVQRLGGDAVKVGDGETSARYRLDGPDEVWNWMRKALHEFA